MSKQYENAENELEDENAIHYKYLSYIIDDIFMRAEYPKILDSYDSEDNTYAKGILNLMYKGLEQIYGTTDFNSSDFMYHAAIVPGIVQLTDSDDFYLGIFAIDMDKKECIRAHAVSSIGFIEVHQQLDEMALGLSVTCPCKNYGVLEDRGRNFLAEFQKIDLELPTIESLQEQQRTMEQTEDWEQ